MSKKNRDTLTTQKQQIDDIISKFNEVSQHINTLEANVVYVFPKLRKDMADLANHIGTIRQQIEAQITVLNQKEEKKAET